MITTAAITPTSIAASTTSASWPPKPMRKRAPKWRASSPADAPPECIFVRNATEGINLVAYAWGRANLKAGDAIVLTEMEHHSNLVPWQILGAGDRRDGCVSCRDG